MIWWKKGENVLSGNEYDGRVLQKQKQASKPSKREKTASEAAAE